MLGTKAEEKIYVKDGSVGKGVFAAKDFSKGEEILQWTGPILSLDEAVALGEETGHPVQIGPKAYVDPVPPGRFVNHSCDPNAGVRNLTTLVAITDIKKDTEIRFDYSTTMDEGLWKMPCLCGSSNCRKTVGDFKDLPSKLKEKYIHLGIVHEFIMAKYT